MSSLLSKIDFLGIKPLLKIGGNYKHKTNIGGMISFLLGLTSLAGFLYFLYVLFSNTNFSIYSTEIFDKYQVGDISDLGFAIALGTQGGLPFKDDEKIYTVKGKIMYVSPDFVNGTSQMVLRYNDIKMEKCNFQKHFAHLGTAQEWNSPFTMIEKSYCPEPGQKMPIARPLGYPNSHQIIFWFQRCVNDTASSNCYPSEIINEKLSNIYFAVRFSNVYFNHLNYTNPAQMYLHGEAISASSTIYKEVTLLMKNIIYDSDDSYIVSSSNRKNYTVFTSRFESTTLSGDERLPGSIGAINVNYGMFGSIISRKYYKLQNMLADFGALIKGLISACLIFNSFMSDAIFYNDIIEQSIPSLKVLDLEENLNKNLKNDNELENIGINNDNQPNNPAASHINPSFIGSPDINTFRSELKPVVAGSTMSLELSNHKSVKISDELCVEKSTKLSLFTYVIPNVFFNKNSNNKNNLLIHSKLKKLVDNEFDLKNMFYKFNLIDKINYVLSGNEKMDYIKNAMNPYLLKNSNVLNDRNIIRLRQEILSKIISEPIA